VRARCASRRTAGSWWRGAMSPARKRSRARAHNEYSTPQLAEKSGHRHRAGSTSAPWTWRRTGAAWQAAWETEPRCSGGWTRSRTHSRGELLQDRDIAA
jgi:hypothetical protein